MVDIPPNIRSALMLQYGEQPLTYFFVDDCVAQNGFSYGTGYMVVTNVRCVFLTISTDVFSTSYREHMSFPFGQITQVATSYDSYRGFVVINGYYFQTKSPEPYKNYIEGMMRDQRPPPPPQ